MTDKNRKELMREAYARMHDKADWYNEELTPAPAPARSACWIAYLGAAVVVAALIWVAL